MTRIQGMRTLGLLLLCAVSAAPARADQVATTLDQLQVLIRPGDEIRVTERDGHSLQARVENITADTLTIRAHGAEQVLRPDDIRLIRQSREDTLSDGAKRGFIAGAALGVLAGLAFAGENPKAAGVFIPIAAATYGGIGAAIGVGIDAMVKTDTVIYDASPRHAARPFSVAPVVARGRKGVEVSVGF